ncbi:hypothetical protein LCGC14_2372610 [marine sediment metagenome]|uniref:Uncharacterized protein n=1 Tax=marine sediment metagenome TaxID=412755 RepID=A0A0F9C3C6_9ZZZZ
MAFKLNAEDLNLSAGEQAALGRLRLDNQVQSLLQAILDGVKHPKYRQKRSVFNQMGDMINQSGYRDGAEDIIELLSWKDRK